MLHALALGADWVWLADDDGRAADEDVLATLVEVAERRGLAAVSPRWSTPTTPTGWRSRAPRADLAPLPRRAGRRHRARRRRRAAARASPRCSTARCSGPRRIDAIGVPDLRLFVRGDEVEMHRRLVRSGLPFGTALRAAYLHPDGADEDKPMLGGRLHARDPDDADQALLHLPQPRLPGVPAGDAADRAAGAAPVRLVLPGHQAQPAASSRSGCGWSARAARNASTAPARASA